MTNSFSIVWSFRNRIDILKRSIITAHETTPEDVNFLLIDAASDEESIQSLREFCVNFDRRRKIRICETDYRTSLSEAWNLGIMLSGSSHVIFSSSDVEFLSDQWFNKISELSNQYEYVLLDNHAVFCLSKSLIPKLGWFDERFSIGPHFDTDYYIRASELNIPVGSFPSIGMYLHGHDSSQDEQLRKTQEVENRLPMHDLTNENYFKSKWRSYWPGWHSGYHPPNHISICKREFEEIDPHPIFTQKFKDKYGQK